MSDLKLRVLNKLAKELGAMDWKDLTLNMACAGANKEIERAVVLALEEKQKDLEKAIDRINFFDFLDCGGNINQEVVKEELKKRLKSEELGRK